MPNLYEFFKKRAIVGIIGGVWAEIPEVDYLLGDAVFHNSGWSNVFFFHFSLDEVLTETDLFFAAEIFLVFAAVNLFALVFCVDSFKRLKEALFGKEEEEEEEEPKEGEGEGEMKEHGDEEKDDKEESGREDVDNKG